MASTANCWRRVSSSRRFAFEAPEVRAGRVHCRAYQHGGRLATSQRPLLAGDTPHLRSVWRPAHHGRGSPTVGAARGRLFAAEHFEAVPYILVMAKGMSSGYLPIAATVVRPYRTPSSRNTLRG